MPKKTKKRSNSEEYEWLIQPDDDSGGTGQTKDLPQLPREGGNTKTLPESKNLYENEKPVDKDSKKLRAIHFVLNNYSEEEIASLASIFREKKFKFIMGREIAPETGTPHIQGYAGFKGKQLRFSQIKKWNGRMKIFNAKGTWEQNVVYCSKEGNIYDKFPLSRKELLLKKYYSNVEWKSWQQDIIDIVERERESRLIHWFWEPRGKVGKSFLCKFLGMKHEAIIANGKQNDVFNQVKGWLERHEDDEESPKLVVLDIPRKYQESICLATLEQLKNGMFYSGKYEGGDCYFDHPHVVVFANIPPTQEIMDNLSEDRWVIREIN